jgi:glycosyltransferase involved in cell wall biosynthesis
MISVIIPMYNSEDTINPCIESVLKQTYKGKVEVIVVNDGSIDNSKTILEKIIKNNNSDIDIQLINKTNGGVSSARNTGLRIAKGDFIALLDSDDEWYPTKLEKQLDLFSNNDSDIDFLTCLRNNEVINFPYKFKNNLAKVTLKKLLIKVIGQTSTAVFKRKILTDVGFFDENQRYSEDANYWMRVSINHNMYILNENLVTTGGGKANFGESGLSSNLVAMEMGARKNIKDMYSVKQINKLEFCLYYSLAIFKFYIRKIKVALQ